MTAFVSSTLDGQQPNLGELIVAQYPADMTRVFSMPDKVTYDVALDHELEVLLLLPEDKNKVAIVRPQHARIDYHEYDMTLENSYPQIVFTDAPIVGTCSLCIKVSVEDWLATLGRFRSLMEGPMSKAKYSVQDSMPLELMDG